MDSSFHHALASASHAKGWGLLLAGGILFVIGFGCPTILVSAGTRCVASSPITRA